MEWLRAKLQDSEQVRGGGMRLGGPAGSVWTPSDADWLAAARMGRRRRHVAGDALAETTVRASRGFSTGFNAPDMLTNFRASMLALCFDGGQVAFMLRNCFHAVQIASMLAYSFQTTPRHVPTPLSKPPLVCSLLPAG
jgi:hypothetical protein